MNASSSNPKRRSVSLRQRTFALLFGLTILGIVIVTILAIVVSNIISSRAQQLTGESLRQQIEAYLVQITQRSASQNDQILAQTMLDVKTASDAASQIYAAAEQAEEQGLQYPRIWIADEHMQIGADGQYIDKPGESSRSNTTSAYVPNIQPITPQVIRDLELSAYLDFVFGPVMQNNPNASAIYLGTKNEITRYYPNINLGAVLPPDFIVTQRPWYTATLDIRETRRNSPTAGNEKAPNQEENGDIPIWIPPYWDAVGRGPVTTVASPVFDGQGRLVGVVGLDITLNDMKTAIENSRFLQNGYSFLLNTDGTAIALPEQGYQDFLQRTPGEDEFGADLSASSLAPVISQMTSGRSGFSTIQTSQGEMFIAYAPLPSTGWSLGSVISAEEVLLFGDIPGLQAELASTTRQLVVQRILPLALIVAIALIILGLVFTNRLVDPLQKLVTAAQQIGAGQWDMQVPVTSHDEIGLLAETLNSMASQLRQTFGQLEERVAERTRQLERRSLQLQTAAQVAREMTSSQNLDELLQNAVDLIRHRFSFYAVSIFLVDEGEEYVYLRAMSVETVDAGERAGRPEDGRPEDGVHPVEAAGVLPEDGVLPQQIPGLRLKVGQQGMIGYVTGQGQSRVAADVRADDFYVESTLFPLTRSEAAFPLRVGREIVGALDVQNSQVNAFDPEDLVVLQTLADQLATAIENVRLLERLQSTLKETSRLYQDQVQQAWENVRIEKGGRRDHSPHGERLPAGLAFSYDQATQRVSPLDTAHPWQAAQSAEVEASTSITGRALTVSLKLRDQVIGVLGLENDDPDFEWSEDAISILQAAAAQAAITLENARLLEETQRQAQNQQLIAHIAGSVRETLDIDTVMQTAIREIGRSLDLAEVEIRLGVPPEEAPDAPDTPTISGETIFSNEKGENLP